MKKGREEGEKREKGGERESMSKREPNYSILLLMLRLHVTQTQSSHPWLITLMAFICPNKSHICI